MLRALRLPHSLRFSLLDRVLLVVQGRPVALFDWKEVPLRPILGVVRWLPPRPLLSSRWEYRTFLCSPGRAVPVRDVRPAFAQREVAWQWIEFLIGQESVGLYGEIVAIVSLVSAEEVSWRRRYLIVPWTMVRFRFLVVWYAVRV